MPNEKMDNFGLRIQKVSVVGLTNTRFTRPPSVAILFYMDGGHALGSATDSAYYSQYYLSCYDFCVKLQKKLILFGNNWDKNFNHNKVLMIALKKYGKKAVRQIFR